MKFPLIVVAGFLACVAAQGSLAPSPTNSVGCEPHGDHWHCKGPKETAAIISPTATESHRDDHDDHDHSSVTGASAATASSKSLPPSPTASINCEPHGDHWHCDGPKTTTGNSTAESNVPSPTAQQADSGAFRSMNSLTGGGVIMAIAGAAVILV